MSCALDMTPPSPEVTEGQHKIHFGKGIIVNFTMALCALVPERQHPNRAFGEWIVGQIGVLAKETIRKSPRLDRIGIEVGRSVHAKWDDNIIIYVFFVRRVEEHLREIRQHGVHVVVVLRVFSEAGGRAEVLKT
jgi:hypothetical protein